MCHSRKRMRNNLRSRTGAERRRSLARDVRGAVAIYVAVAAPVLLGIGALSVDLGRVMTVNTELQNAADAQAAGKHSGGHGHGHGHGGGHAPAVNIGETGKASEATRIIEIVMTDNRLSPERISVEKGQTIRFVVKNKGEFVHEFNVGTAAMHAKHQKEMAMMFERGILEVDKIHHDKMKMDMGGGHTMAHNDPNTVLLEPGKSAEIVWKFDTDAKLEFACNLPGHYQSGMKGKFSIG